MNFIIREGEMYWKVCEDFLVPRPLIDHSHKRLFSSVFKVIILFYDFGVFNPYLLSRYVCTILSHALVTAEVLSKVQNN